MYSPFVRLSGWGGLVEDLLRHFPEVEQALREAGASLVVFEAPDAPGEPASAFAAVVQQALERAEASLPAGVGRPIFVCECHVSQLRSLWSLRPPDRASAPLLRVRVRRGSFGGYVGLGEGGAVAFDRHGARHGSWEGARGALLALTGEIG